MINRLIQAHLAAKNRLKIEIQASAATLGLHVGQAVSDEITQTLDRLTYDELDGICQMPGCLTERYPMRAAKILLQVCGERIMRDFDAEAIKPQVRRIKRVLKRRL